MFSQILTSGMPTDPMHPRRAFLITLFIIAGTAITLTVLVDACASGPFPTVPPTFFELANSRS